MGDERLSDVRVLDLSRLLPGGLCTLVLADLGADVVKVESPGGGDYARARGPHVDGAEESTSSASFRALNRNKRSIVLDLKSERGRADFLELVATSDVVLESFRPGVLDRLRIGWPVLQATNPRIVLCQISGWGQEGPLAQSAGHDINYLAATGLLSPTGRPDDPPVLSSMQVGDASAGLFAACAILAALRRRDRTGAGECIDVSIAHSALMLTPMTIAGALATRTAQPAAQGIWSGGAVCYQVYPCRDGWVALGALEHKFWTRFCLGVERPDLLDHAYEPPGSWAHAEITELVRGRTREQWADFGARHDCCLTVVTGLLDALDSPLVRERGMVRSLPHPPDERYEGLALPVSFSPVEPDYERLPAPALGAHQADLLDGPPD
jgi:alpha-methylacyl-CoA racemase